MPTTWESSSDWQEALDETGIIHEGSPNPDYNDSSMLRKGYSKKGASLMDGLELWMPLHDENAQDLSGNGNHGSISGGVTTGVAGRGGLDSMSFNGSDGAIDTGLNTDTTTAQTWSVWFYPRQLGHGTYSNDRIISDQRRDIRVLDSGEISFRWYDGGEITTPAETNRWYHGVVVYDGSGTIEAFVDGSSIGTDSVSSTDNSETLIIGSNPNSDTPFDGNIFGARVYSRTLSSDEIQTLYEWGSVDLARPPEDGVARYPLDGDATDAWGSNDGTNNGATFVNDSIRGQAGSFDGSVGVDTPVSDFGAPFTWSAWVKYSGGGGGGNEMPVISTRGSQSGAGLRERGNGQWEFYAYDADAGSYMQIETDGPAYIGNWIHLAVTFDGSSASIWKNGIEEGAGSVGSYGAGNPYTIGKRADGQKMYEGNIDDPRIYDRVLAGWEIQEIYQWGTRGKDMREEVVNA